MVHGSLRARLGPDQRGEMMATQDLRARVKRDGVEYYLGKFSTPAQAREAELKFRAAHGWPTELREIQSDASMRGWRTARRMGVRP